MCRFPIWKSPGKQPTKKRGIKRFLSQNALLGFLGFGAVHWFRVFAIRGHSLNVALLLTEFRLSFLREVQNVVLNVRLRSAHSEPSCRSALRSVSGKFEWSRLSATTDLVLRPERPFTGVSGPSGPKYQKKISNWVFWGVRKKVPENTRKSPKIPKMRLWGVFFDSFGYFRGLLLNPQSHSFWDFLGISGPKGPETPVNGRSGRKPCLKAERSACEPECWYEKGLRFFVGYDHHSNHAQDRSWLKEHLQQ